MNARMCIALLAGCLSLCLAGCGGGGAAPRESGSGTEAPAAETLIEEADAAPETADPEESAQPEATPEPEETTMIAITVGDTTLLMTPADTEAAAALVEHLREGAITLQLSEYGGFEKVGPLPWSLPRTDSQIDTEPGDVVLYQGDQISMFYSPSSWSYTRLGRIDGTSAEELRAAFGEGDITVVLALA